MNKNGNTHRNGAPFRWLALAKLLARVGFVLPLWLSLHGTAAQAQACTQVTVFNHPTYQAFRTNGATGTCTLPSGIVMSWSHVGANRGLTSFGCTPYDPTYWMDGGTMTVTFSQPVNDVGFLIWGLDGGDTATVNVGTSTQAPPTTLSRDFVDLCPGFTTGTPPTVVNNIIQGGAGGYFGQVAARASNATPYTTLTLTVQASGGGFGLVAVASPNAIAPPGPPPGPTAAAVPTLSGWATVALAVLMALGAFWIVRRRRV